MLGLPANLNGLLYREATASGRTVEEHLRHIIHRRYMHLRRVCDCGFFVYDRTDDLSCAGCGKLGCPSCLTPKDHRDYCDACGGSGERRQRFEAAS